MNIKKVMGIICITIFSLGFTKQETDLKIGLAISFIGDGIFARWGAEMAVEEINKNGGINKKRLTLVIEDDKGSREGAISAAEKLANQEGILAVVGHIYSTATLAAAPIYNKSGIVQLSPTSTSSAVSSAGNWTYRVCTNDIFQARDLGRYAAKALDKSRIGIFYEDGVYGEKLRDEFNKAIRVYGKTVVHEAKYSQTEKNYIDLVKQMNDSKPDLIFIAGYTDQGLEIIKEIRNSGGNYDILGADGLYAHDFIERGGKDTEGVMVARLFNHKSNNSKTQVFIENFKKKHNVIPNDNAAYTYDAVKLIAEALKHDLSRSGVRDYLNQINKKHPVYDGVTGKILFDKNGDCPKPVVIMVIKDSELEIP